jgi:glycerophosphoryl diester phosphodiesterase
MRAVYDAGVDGMTVNFPDKLLQYIVSVTPALEEE